MIYYILSGRSGFLPNRGDSTEVTHVFLILHIKTSQINHANRIYKFDSFIFESLRRFK